GQTIEAVVDLDRVEFARIVFEPALDGQLLGIEQPAPVLVDPAGATDPDRSDGGRGLARHPGNNAGEGASAPARAPTQVYLISPLDVSGAFPQRLERALGAGPVAAFQFRVKGLDQHEAARLAAPLQ